MKIKEVPEYARPYEKALTYGVSSLNEVELLAILLRTGTKKTNVIELCEKILLAQDQKPHLHQLYEHNMETLQTIDGIGKVKAVQLLSILEIAKRLLQAEALNKENFTTPKTISDFFMPMVASMKEEHFIAVLLDAKCKLLHYQVISKGSLTASIVHPREVYKYAISKSAYGLIALHNHPSGDPTPSKEDILITQRLEEVGKMIGIPLLDHIILGSGRYKSLKELSYL